jgi:hypothetical protein
MLTGGCWIEFWLVRFELRLSQSLSDVNVYGNGKITDKLFTEKAKAKLFTEK